MQFPAHLACIIISNSFPRQLCFLPTILKLCSLSPNYLLLPGRGNLVPPYLHLAHKYVLRPSDVGVVKTLVVVGLLGQNPGPRSNLFYHCPLKVVADCLFWLVPLSVYPSDLLRVFGFYISLQANNPRPELGVDLCRFAQFMLSSGYDPAMVSGIASCSFLQSSSGVREPSRLLQCFQLTDAGELRISEYIQYRTSPAKHPPTISSPVEVPSPIPVANHCFESFPREILLNVA